MKLLAVLDRIGQPGNGKRQANPLERANAEIQRLRNENARLKNVEGLLDEAGIEISGLRLDVEQLANEAKFQAGRATRAEADNRRLVASLKNTQKALKDAQPRITTVPALDRPYVPGEVILPYRLPAGSDTSNEDTQNLALLDLPLSVQLATAGAVTVSGGI
ncbi:hypothetical protein ABZ312_11655 [Streptomyces sp. NPDC006207]